MPPRAGPEQQRDRRPVAGHGVHRLPALRRGDLVAISGCGAYASALVSRYNGRPRPAEVFMCSGGDLELAHAREQVI